MNILLVKYNVKYFHCKLTLSLVDIPSNLRTGRHRAHKLGKAGFVLLKRRLENK